MKLFKSIGAAIVAVALLFTPAAFAESDSLDTSGLYFGVGGGVGLEQFLSTPTDQFVLEGAIAYETPRGFWFEFGAASVGEDAQEALKVKAGYVLYKDETLRLLGGVEWLNGVDSTAVLPPTSSVRVAKGFVPETGRGWGAWASSLIELDEGRFLRITFEYDQKNKGIMPGVGFFVKG